MANDHPTPLNHAPHTVQPPSASALVSAQGRPTVADLGQVFAHLASRAAGAQVLANRAVSDGDIELIDPLTDCLACIGMIADMAAKSCGQPYLYGGLAAWQGGGSVSEALARLSSQASAQDKPGSAA